jgi:nitrite reductase/ring-hydroxylating ferredoxin subunit
LDTDDRRHHPGTNPLGAHLMSVLTEPRAALSFRVLCLRGAAEGMEREAELEWIRRFLAHLDAGTTDLASAALRLPASVYTSAAHCTRERDLVFRRRPVVAGFSCELAEPGAYFTLEIGGIPVVVMRDADGRVGAFVNLCRHRGGPVAQGRGRADGGHLRCPFHAWTYTTSGALAATPNAEDSGSRHGVGSQPRR